jgi:hypothetical protein
VGDEGLAELLPPNGWRLGLVELCRYERGNGLKKPLLPSSNPGLYSQTVWPAVGYTLAIRRAVQEGVRHRG